jgi:hypothetical protein
MEVACGVNVDGCGKDDVCEFGDGRENKYSSADVVSEM